MSDRAKLTMNNYLLSTIILLLSIIGYFYINTESTQTEAIDKLLEVSVNHNTRLTRVETTIGLY